MKDFQLNILAAVIAYNNKMTNCACRRLVNKNEFECSASVGGEWGCASCLLLGLWKVLK